MIALPTFRGCLSGFSPLSVNPNAWWSSTGSDPAQWNDISGNGRHMIQSTSANRPAIITGALNGRQVRRFDSTDFFFNSNVGVSSVGDMTLIAVHDYDSLAGSLGWEPVIYNGLLGAGASANGQLGLQRRQLTNEFGCHHSGVNNIGTFASLGSGILNPRISMLRRSNSGATGLNGIITIRSNGSSATGTQNWNTGVTSSSIQLGGRQQNTFVSPFIGDIAEALVFSRAISDAEANMLFTFFSSLYAIALT